MEINDKIIILKPEHYLICPKKWSYFCHFHAVPFACGSDSTSFIFNLLLRLTVSNCRCVLLYNNTHARTFFVRFHRLVYAQTVNWIIGLKNMTAILIHCFRHHRGKIFDFLAPNTVWVLFVLCFVLFFNGRESMWRFLVLRKFFFVSFILLLVTLDIQVC